jgi:uncharacterized membrane protein
MYRGKLYDKRSAECVATIQYPLRVSPILTSSYLSAAQNFSYTTCDYPANENTTVYHVINIVGIIVAIVSVALRITNRIVGGQVGLDDHTIVGALFVAVAIAGVGFPRMSEPRS